MERILYAGFSPSWLQLTCCFPAFFLSLLLSCSLPNPSHCLYLLLKPPPASTTTIVLLQLTVLKFYFLGNLISGFLPFLSTPAVVGQGAAKPPPLDAQWQALPAVTGRLLTCTQCPVHQTKCAYLSFYMFVPADTQPLFCCRSILRYNKHIPFLR